MVEKTYAATVRYSWKVPGHVPEETIDLVLKGIMHFDDQDISGTLRYASSQDAEGDLEGQLSREDGTIALAFRHYLRNGAVEGYAVSKEDNGSLRGVYDGTLVFLPGRRDEYEGEANLERVVADTIHAGQTGGSVACTLTLGHSRDRKGAKRVSRARGRVLPAKPSPVYAR